MHICGAHYLPLGAGFYNPSKRYYVKGVINALLKYAAVGTPMAAAIIWHCHYLALPFAIPSLAFLLLLPNLMPYFCTWLKNGG